MKIMMTNEQASRLRGVDCPTAPRPREVIDEQVSDVEVQYAVGEIIGQGTFGKVFKAKNLRDGQPCALKVVLQEKKYKNRELSIISSIDHWNVVRLIDSFYTVVVNPGSLETYLNLVTNLMPSTLFAQLRNKKKKPAALEPFGIKLMAFQLFKVLAYFEVLKCSVRISVWDTETSNP